MGRPRLTSKLVRFDINLTLREGEDDDLIRFLSHIPRRQRVRTIKRALRTGSAFFANEPGQEEELMNDAFDALFL